MVDKITPEGCNASGEQQWAYLAVSTTHADQTGPVEARAGLLECGEVPAHLTGQAAVSGAAQLAHWQQKVPTCDHCHIGFETLVLFS